MAGALICFLMAAINVPFIVANPAGAVFNWASAVFCLALGFACVILELRY